jgi:hypothetical protein
MVDEVAKMVGSIQVVAVDSSFFPRLDLDLEPANRN